MKKLTQVVLALLLTVGLSSAAAHADTVSFTLTDATQYISPQGGTLVYEVTATAPLSNSAAINLNGDSYNVTGPLTVDDTDFLLGPASLNPGESETFDLFTLNVPSGTLPGTYLGFFTVLGGPGGEQDPLGTVNFSATVTPEPSSLVLLGTGVAGALTALRRKRLS